MGSTMLGTESNALELLPMKMKRIKRKKERRRTLIFALWEREAWCGLQGRMGHGRPHLLNLCGLFTCAFSSMNQQQRPVLRRVCDPLWCLLAGRCQSAGTSSVWWLMSSLFSHTL